MEEQMCPEWGFPIDEANESQPVCPRCGADPLENLDSAGPAISPFPGVAFEDVLGMSRQPPVITPGNNLIH
jgi:hypothetical protein